MGFTITYELDETPDRKLTRRELSRLLGCHYNTLRDDELLIKQWVPDAGKYYYSDNPAKLEAVELTPYLIWLLVQVRNFKTKGYTSKSIARLLFIEKPEQFSEKGFNAYVYHQNRKTRSATAA